VSSFEYLGILVSVVLGLALARLTSNVSRSIKRKADYQPYWVQWVWTFNVWLLLLGVWWGMVSWDFLDGWTFFLFLFIMLYATLLFMLADALYPYDMVPGTDLKAHFFEHRRWFFGLFALCSLIDIPETILKETFDLRPVPAAYPVLVSSWFVIAVVGMATSNPRVHAVLAIAWPVVFLAFVSQALLVMWGG